MSASLICRVKRAFAGHTAARQPFPLRQSVHRIQKLRQLASLHSGASFSTKRISLTKSVLCSTFALFARKP